MVRLGVRVGPFVAVSGGRTGCAPWIGAFVVLCLIAAGFVDHPWIASGVTAGLIAVVVVLVRRARKKPPLPSVTGE